MTCKDCVHYEKCKPLRLDFANSVNPNHTCQHFKNKADFVEVKHGEWEIKSEIHQMFDDVDEEIYVECPFCKRTFYVPFEFEDEKILEFARKSYPYCHCGAKMDGERRCEE